MDRKLLKTVQTITTFWNRLADPVGTRRGPPLVRGPQFENRLNSTHVLDSSCGNAAGLAVTALLLNFVVNDTYSMAIVCLQMALFQKSFNYVVN